jgi:hypothetical protein
MEEQLPPGSGRASKNLPDKGDSISCGNRKAGTMGVAAQCTHPFLQQEHHHEQEPGQQESSEERAREVPEGKEGSEEDQEGSQQAAMMLPAFAPTFN